MARKPRRNKIEKLQEELSRYESLLTELQEKTIVTEAKIEELKAEIETENVSIIADLIHNSGMSIEELEMLIKEKQAQSEAAAASL